MPRHARNHSHPPRGLCRAPYLCRVYRAVRTPKHGASIPNSASHLPPPPFPTPHTASAFWRMASAKRSTRPRARATASSRQQRSPAGSWGVFPFAAQSTPRGRPGCSSLSLSLDSKTKVFLKYFHLEELEAMVTAFQKRAVVVQKCWLCAGCFVAQVRPTIPPPPNIL